MRHKISGNRLSRNKSLRAATLRDMAKAVLIQERICTTRAKAKEARRLIEKLITLGKKDTLPARRRAFAILCDHSLVSQLFQQTAPRFKSRAGGYTRIIPYGQRSGDNAELAFLELTEKSREIVTGAKRVKAETETGAATSKVTDAQTRPAKDAKAKEPKAGKESKPGKEKPGSAEGHSKADIKAGGKAAAKPTGVKKLFQRKTGGE